MKTLNRFLITVAMCLSGIAATNAQNTPNMTKIEVETTAGNFVVGLYNDTPKHRDNFVKLVGEGYYNGLLFHRVIKDFMVQTGDPDSRNATPGQMLGAGSPDYLIDAEILFPAHINKRGALAAARTADQVNPERKSSGSQFYVVTGRKSSDAELDQYEQYHNKEQMQAIFNKKAMEKQDTIRAMYERNDKEGLQKLENQLRQETLNEAKDLNFKYTPEQRAIYREQGGAPHLDGAYTVFGEVLQGMDVIDKIEGVATDQNDRPKEDVRIISMKILN